MATGYLTDPATTSRAPLPAVPSSSTWVAALVTAGVLVLLFSVLVQWVGADHSCRDRAPDTGPFRALVAVALFVLAAAAGVNLGAG